MKRGEPVRTCIGCGQRDRAAALVRLVRRGNGCLSIDSERREPGRGGYLHKVEDCWSRFARRGGTIRSFRANVQLQARVALLTELRAGVDL
jgi:hypothetical protein